MNRYELRNLRRLEKYPTTLSDRQKALVYGTVLGDGCLRWSFERGEKDARLQCKHGLKQAEFLRYKFEVMRPFINMEQPSIMADKSGFSGSPRILFNTATHPVFTEIYRNFYTTDRAKVVTSQVLSEVDSYALAIWFCDDGYLAYRNRSHLARISTESFSVGENELIRDWFLDRWNIKCSLQSAPSGGKRLHFSSRPAKQLVELIRPHVIESMQYKVTLHNSL